MVTGKIYCPVCIVLPDYSQCQRKRHCLFVILIGFAYLESNPHRPPPPQFVGARILGARALQISMNARGLSLHIASRVASRGQTVSSGCEQWSISSGVDWSRGNDIGDTLQIVFGRCFFVFLIKFQCHCNTINFDRLYTGVVP